MNVASLARESRQRLGQGLAVLQAGGLPESLLVVAEPLAKAMGMLVRMEAAAPDLARKGAGPVLEALREGLRLLQMPDHLQLPAAADAMSHVADALGLVRQIAEGAQGVPRPVRVGAQPASSLGGGAGAQGAAAASPAARLAEPAPPPAAAAPAVGEAEEQLRAVAAELGAHSATNFYKGLAGGDIVASGGLFVATYQIPPVGQPLLLKVSMPGGYEFEAKAVVAWTRDVRATGTASGATPGFGAQFSEISDEGRSLIQRYVRNREPLFHDDL